MSQSSISLELKDRQAIGKRLRALRATGQVPAVIHDHGKPSVIVQAEYNLLSKAVSAAGKHSVIELKLGSKKYTSLVKDISFDPYRNTITHVVFDAVHANEKVAAEVPIHIRYAEGQEVTPAERTGLIVLHNTETVEIEALPRDLPEALYFAAELLTNPGDQATVSDLETREGVVVKEDDTTVLATAFEPSALAAANDSAGGDAEDTADVPAENGGDTDQGDQAEESMPGGKSQDEPKQSNVDANK